MAIRSPRQRANFIRLMRKYLVGRDGENLADLIEGSHPTDIAHILERFDLPALVVFCEIVPPEKAAEVWQELGVSSQVELLEQLDLSVLSSILNALPADELVDLLSELPQDRVRDLLPSLEDGLAIKKLLRYRGDTAGGRMTTEFIAFSGDTSVKQCIDDLRELHAEAETIYYVYIVDEEGRVRGTVSLRDILSAAQDQVLEQVMTTDIVTVSQEADQGDVVNLFATYGLLAIPVVDEARVLLGIVTVDDAFEVLEDERAEDLALSTGLLVRQPRITQPAVDLLEAKWQLFPRRAFTWFFMGLVGIMGVLWASGPGGLDLLVGPDRGDLFLVLLIVVSFATASRGKGLIWLWNNGEQVVLRKLSKMEFGLSLVLGSGSAAGFWAYIYAMSADGELWPVYLLVLAPLLGTALGIGLGYVFWFRRKLVTLSFSWLLAAVALTNLALYWLLAS